MIELNQMLTIYSPLDILHLSYRTLVFEKFKAREDQVAPPKNPTDWKRGVIVKHSTAVFPRQHQEKYDGAYWRRDAYTAKEWTTGTLTTCGAADVTIMLNMLKYIFQPQSVSGTGEPVRPFHHSRLVRSSKLEDYHRPFHRYPKNRGRIDTTYSTWRT